MSKETFIKETRSYTRYLMWGLAVLYYIYQYTIRVSPSVMMEDIMMAFHVSAHGFASLSALAMYTYAIMQIPAGLFTDTFGAKKAILGSILLCITGLVCFSYAQTLWVASVGRILIGCGSAAAFLSVNKIGASWFLPQQRAFVFGLTMTAGTIGALNGGAPLAMLSEAVGWRFALLILSILGIVIFSVNFFFLAPAPSKASEPQKHQEVMGLFKSIIYNKQILIIAIVALGLYMSISVLADLWGVAYLMQTYNISKAAAAQSASLIYVGLCIGALVISSWSDKIRKRKIFIVSSSLLIIAGLVVFLHYPCLPFSVACCLLFLIGFCSGSEMICFALATELVPPPISGTAIGYINAVVTLGGAFIQQQVGRFLDYIWDGQYTNEGVRLYSCHHYRISLSLVVCVVVITALFSLLTKEHKVEDPHTKQ